MAYLNEIDEETLGTCMQNLAEFGAGVIAEAVSKAGRERILQELSECSWREAIKEKGVRRVRQEFDFAIDIPEDGDCRRFGYEVEDELNILLHTHFPGVLPELLNLSELVVQRYDPDTGGIEPHRDPQHFAYLVIIVILKGEGCFYLCDDSDGTNPRPVQSNAGDMILLRAPGLKKERVWPYHFVKNGSKARITLSLRHDKSQREKAAA